MRAKSHLCSKDTNHISSWAKVEVSFCYVCHLAENTLSLLVGGIAFENATISMSPPSQIAFKNATIPMQSPSHPVLQKLCDLDRSPPGFHDQLSNVLYGEEYVGCVTGIQGDDLKWLVDFLDEVRQRVFLPRLPLKPA